MGRRFVTELLHKELTGAIIGAYYEVYNHTSRNYPEYIYERAMIQELQQRGYPTHSRMNIASFTKSVW